MDASGRADIETPACLEYGFECFPSEATGRSCCPKYQCLDWENVGTFVCRCGVGEAWFEEERECKTVTPFPQYVLILIIIGGILALCVATMIGVKWARRRCRGLKSQGASSRVNRESSRTGNPTFEEPSTEQTETTISQQLEPPLTYGFVIPPLQQSPSAPDFSSEFFRNQHQDLPPSYEEISGQIK